MNPKHAISRIYPFWALETRGKLDNVIALIGEGIFRRRWAKFITGPAANLQGTYSLRMPVKQVRFARERKVYPPSPYPDSISSLPSSSGSISPPSTPHYPPPGQFLYSPAPAHRHHHHHHRRSSHPPNPRPDLHPLLAVSKPRAVNYDFTRHYSHISTPYSSLSSRKGVLSEPATFPSVSRMTVTSPHMPWRIHVHPTLNGSYVTVSDVLRSIHYDLRENLTHAEFYGLGRRELQRVTEAYQDRYRCIRNWSASMHEKSKGVKRVDYFMGRTYFVGLSSGSRSDYWVMNVV